MAAVFTVFGQIVASANSAVLMYTTFAAAWHGQHCCGNCQYEVYPRSYDSRNHSRSNTSPLTVHGPISASGTPLR